MVKSYLSAIDPGNTPPTKPLPGREHQMTTNHDGHAVFKVDDWGRLDRFLILGTDRPTFYASQREITIENIDVLRRCVSADGIRTVDRIVKVSEAGLAPKNDPAILALAYCSLLGDVATRVMAYDKLPYVCRTGTHLLHFCAARESIAQPESHGWSRGMRHAVARWFQSKGIKDATYQAMKYKQRDGWSMRDVLRLAHPKPLNGYGPLFHYITHGPEGVGEEINRYAHLKTIEDQVTFGRAIEFMSACENVTQGHNDLTVANLIRQYDLPREVIPTNHLTSPIVWDALLDRMPMTALIRNLGNLTKLGVPMLHQTCKLRTMDGKPLITRDNLELIVERLTNEDALKKARVHPFTILTALRTYQSGKGFKGSGQWEPIPRIIDALDAAFYKAFRYVEPSRMRTLLCLDISGSMGSAQAGTTNLTAREASAALAMTYIASEPNVRTVGFHHSLMDLDLSARRRLDDVCRYIAGLGFGATDCSLPFEWALKQLQSGRMDNGAPEVFIVFTDNETNQNRRHPSVALKDYRRQTGIDAKLIVVGMAANGFSIADPDDPGMLDVVGMSADVPQLLTTFAKGTFAGAA